LLFGSLLVDYAKKHQEIEMWCLLQPTSPLRTADDIKLAYKEAKKQKWDCLVSVTPDPLLGWYKDATSMGHISLYHPNKRPNRQTRLNKWFRENGAIYFTKTYTLFYSQCRIAGDIALYVMPKERSFEIDDEIDWRICEMLMWDETSPWKARGDMIERLAKGIEA